MKVFLKTDENGKQYFELKRSDIDALVMPYIESINKKISEIAIEIQTLIEKNEFITNECRNLGGLVKEANIKKIKDLLNHLEQGIDIKIKENDKN